MSQDTSTQQEAEARVEGTEQEVDTHTSELRYNARRAQWQTKAVWTCCRYVGADLCDIQCSPIAESNPKPTGPSANRGAGAGANGWRGVAGSDDDATRADNPAWVSCLGTQVGGAIDRQSQAICLCKRKLL